jgi:hypothetical protein
VLGPKTLNFGTNIEQDDSCVTVAAAIAGTKNNNGIAFNKTLFFIRQL